MSETPRIYQLKLSLHYVRPPVWRRILVDGKTPLNKPHRIFQVVMGWDNYHLHAFRVNDVSYGEPDPSMGSDWMQNERRVLLQTIAPEAGAKFGYEYDFGDGWHHLVSVEKIRDADPKAVYPLCIKGTRACPPEDCGGPGGYAHFLEAVSDPAHEDHDDLVEWVGGAFDPEAFDLNAVNKALRRLR